MKGAHFLYNSWLQLFHRLLDSNCNGSTYHWVGAESDQVPLCQRGI